MKQKILKVLVIEEFKLVIYQHLQLLQVWIQLLLIQHYQNHHLLHQQDIQQLQHKPEVLVQFLKTVMLKVQNNQLKDQKFLLKINSIVMKRIFQIEDIIFNKRNQQVQIIKIYLK